MKRLFFTVGIVVLAFDVHAQTISQRKQEFQSILSKQKTQELKITKAQQLAQDKTSAFRVDAINYLIDQKSVSSEDVFIKLIQDKEVSEFAIYGAAELEFVEATPYMIQALKSQDRNVRGNAAHALEQLYPQDFKFEYHYDDPEKTRTAVVQKVEQWWSANGDIFTARAKKRRTDKEKKDAQERWEKYGKNYLNRTSP